MAANNSGAADRGATRLRAYPVSLRRAAAAIFGISPFLNHSAVLPARPSTHSKKPTGKISES